VSRRRDTFERAGDELRRLIREGFERGIPASHSPRRTGLSMSRVYQIRDGRR
jgi:hypothetical protein